MSYAVVFLDEFTKQFRRLPGNVKSRVRQRVVELSVDPYLGQVSRRVVGLLEG